MRVLALLTLVFPLICNAASAEYLKIFMMQPRDIILEKIDGVDELDRYVKEVQKNINVKISGMQHPASWGFVVMAVRQDGKIKAWLDSDEKFSDEVTNSIIETAQKTKPFSVNRGVVVFALGFSVNGAELPMNKVPFPNEWKTFAKCSNEDCAEKNAEAIVLDSW